MNYYVYYKVDAAKLPALSVAVGKLLGRVKEKFRIQGRWMRRRDDPTTYMEVYEGVADDAAFDAFLEQEGRALGVERRVERFVLTSEL